MSTITDRLPTMDPRRRGRPALAASLLLLLLAADGARCDVPTVRFARRQLPPEYESRLQILKLALALDEQWSPVWSEKLKANAANERHPNPEFCKNLSSADGGAGTAVGGVAKAEGGAGTAAENGQHVVDTYAYVRRIVQSCSFSGMYVQYGLELIGSSVRCLFYRFARIDLSAVAVLVELGDDTYHEYLRDLVVGYREIADKLAVVGESLHDVVQLAAFFDDVEKQSVKLNKAKDEVKLEAFHEEVLLIANKIQANLDSGFNRLCAVSEVKWYDKEKNETVDLEKFKDSDDKGAVMEKANKLRTLMRTVFERLVVREMSQDMWKEIFTMNVLIKADDISEVASHTTPNLAVEDIAFQL